MSTEEPKPKQLFTWILPIPVLLLYFLFLRPMVVEATGGGGGITMIIAAVIGAGASLIGGVIDKQRA